MEASVSPTPATSVLVLADSFMTARFSYEFGSGPLIKAAGSLTGSNNLVGSHKRSGSG